MSAWRGLLIVDGVGRTTTVDIPGLKVFRRRGLRHDQAVLDWDIARISYAAVSELCLLPCRRDTESQILGLRASERTPWGNARPNLGLLERGEGADDVGIIRITGRHDQAVWTPLECDLGWIVHASLYRLVLHCNSCSAAGLITCSVSKRALASKSRLRLPVRIASRRLTSPMSSVSLAAWPCCCAKGSADIDRVVERCLHLFE